LSLKHTVFEIFYFKNVVTLKTGLGVRQSHWKCHHAIERIQLPVDVFIVNMALSHVVSEIFNVEKCRDLETGVIVHSRSLKVAPFDRLCNTQAIEWWHFQCVWFPVSVL